jgi:hypothetical protein
VSLQEVPPRIHWECPECREAGVIDGWKWSDDELSAISDAGSIGSEVRAVISRTGYQLLLDELITDRECERMLYRARPHPDGVELSGLEDEFDVLTDAVAFEVNHASNRTKRLRWNEIYDHLDPPGQDWIESFVDVVADELSHFELVVGRAPVADLIRERISMVVSQLGISEQSARQYMTEDALRELARGAALELADEQPGADLFGQPRTISVAIPTIGRTLAALAEAAHVRVANQDTIGAHGFLEMISLLGQRLSEHSNTASDAVSLPQAALTRSARLLEATADMIDQGAVTSYDLMPDTKIQLASMFAEDAVTLRGLVDEQGTATGPSTIN